MGPSHRVRRAPAVVPGAASAGEDDARLVAEAIRGLRPAFRALYDRHRPMLVRMVRGFADLDRDDVDDVVQESFVRAFHHLAGLKERARFGPWLLTIARNRCFSRLSRRKAAEQLADDLGRETEAISETLSGLPEVGADAELEVVRRIIAELPEGAEKETVQLFYVEGTLSAREIAERLGVGKSAITMRLERFRAKVKKRLLAEVAKLRGEGS
jgi:RNA polymerase sigma-70 factor, ECF subfamily